MENRLTPEEQAVIEKSEKFWMHGTPENRKHWRRAVTNLVKAKPKPKGETQ